MIRSTSAVLRFKFRRRQPLAMGSAACILLGALLRAQEAPVERDPLDEEEVVREGRFEVSEKFFDSWLFRRGEDAAAARKGLEEQLSLRLDDVGRVGAMSPAERQKLELAGKGDIERYFERVEQVRRKFLEVRRNAEKFNEIWRDIQPLQRNLQFGLFEASSFFRKALGRSVSSDLAARYEAELKERRSFRHRAALELFVAMLDDVLPLEGPQRERILDLLTSRTRPQRDTSDHDLYVILWQTARIPEDDIKPIFTEDQWKLLDQQFQQAKGLEPYLRENGSLALEGDPPPKEEETPPKKDEEKKEAKK